MEYNLVEVMGEPASISAMVAKAVNAGLTSPEPKRRRRKVAKEAEERARRIASLSSSGDSDFDDMPMSDAEFNKTYKHKERELHQHVLNVFTLDTIETQERKVHVTTAICVRDCPEKAEETAKLTKRAKPVLSKAPKRKLVVDKKTAKRDVELDMILAEAVEEMKRYL